MAQTIFHVHAYLIASSILFSRCCSQWLQIGHPQRLNQHQRNNGGDAGNRNPRELSLNIPSGFNQPLRHSSSASNVPPIPQFPDERSWGRTKSVPRKIIDVSDPHFNALVFCNLKTANYQNSLATRMNSSSITTCKDCRRQVHIDVLRAVSFKLVCD